MATRDDGRVRVMQIDARQGMALGLGMAAAEAAGEAARLGGYRLTDEEQRRVLRALREGVLAMIALVEDWGAVSDEQIEGAARDLGVLVVRQELGPAPMSN